MNTCASETAINFQKLPSPAMTTPWLASRHGRDTQPTSIFPDYPGFGNAQPLLPGRVDALAIMAHLFVQFDDGERPPRMRFLMRRRSSSSVR